MDTLDYKNAYGHCPKCHSTHIIMDPTLALTTYPPQFNFLCDECGHTWTDFEKTQFPTVTEGRVSVEPFNYGWICPKCGRVYSPTTSQCPFCGGACSPNIVYCGPNNGTKAVYDTMTISNTVDSSQINATMADMAKHALHEELQNSIKNSKK